MTDQRKTDLPNDNTIYGSAVAVLKDGQIIMSRRSESVIFPKKWQFVHGRLHTGEMSIKAAIRLVYDQMDISIEDKMRFKFVKSIENDEKREMYFVYLLSLNSDEMPVNTCDRFRGDWRAFDLEKAIPLDVIDGVRPILKKLHKTKLKYETYLLNSVGKNFDVSQGGVLTEREARTLAKLGPKMTRLV